MTTQDNANGSSQGEAHHNVRDDLEKDTSGIGKSQLAQSLMLEEQPPSGLLRLFAVVIFIAVIVFSVWASNTRISEVVSGSGAVAPFGSVKNVQHLEGGIVEEINVRDGDIVDEGDIIMKLSPGAVMPERDQMRVRLKALEEEAVQLRTIIQNIDKIETLDMGVELLSPKLENGMASTQVEILRSKQKAMFAQFQVIERQISQKVIERENLVKKIESIKSQVGTIKQQLDIRSNLMNQGLQPKLVMLDTQRELSRTNEQLIEAQGLYRQLGVAVEELKSRKMEIFTRLHMEASENLGKVTTEMAELKEILSQIEDRFSRLTIVSPVKGVVQNLRTQTIGGVIPPGETIAEIIPLNVEMRVEARISTEDIGYIYEGQEASVKVLTFDPARYGDINGKIERISATTNTDETGKPFYLAMIQLEQNYVGDDPQKNRLVPGMTTVSDIRTGERSLTEYLFKPIYVAFSQAFRER